MSPRSEEFMDAAGARLLQARSDLEHGFLAGAVNAAYYAMLYAARAALSEHDENAKTHRGTWHLFRERFVIAGGLETRFVEGAQRAQRLREAGDYDAREPSREDADSVLADAESFVKVVRALIAA